MTAYLEPQLVTIWSKFYQPRTGNRYLTPYSCYGVEHEDGKNRKIYPLKLARSKLQLSLGLCIQTNHKHELGFSLLLIPET